MAHQKLLSKKHALEEQQELFRRKKEELDLDMELAASMAKVSVFQASEGSCVSHVSVQSDGMNSSLDRGKRTQLSRDAAIFVPEFNTQPSAAEAVGEVLLPCQAAVRPKAYNKSQLPAAVTMAGLSTLPAVMTGVDQPTLCFSSTS
ncbi:hypothetical protein DPEC_G00157070 [Dallia pectoralis]|uniref:Uncharacterized protein n=1 Tax=Dallia pectoralis TaxID=75939 RepID=A0ACC2GLF2_DALPE|nr:hypothetical protein DPEC_G00157070 [Dallia pectoralis]